MRPVAELKKDIDSVGSLGDIVDVLKSVSLIEFRVFMGRQKPGEECSLAAANALSVLKAQANEALSSQAFFNERSSLPTAIVVLTTDDGFLGELNSLLINASMNVYDEDNKDEFIIVGERGSRYLEDLKKKFTFFPGLTDSVGFSEVARIRDYLFKDYEQRFGKVLVVYPEFISFAVQRVAVFQALPIKVDVVKTAGSVVKDMIIEPSVIRVAQALVEVFLGARLLSLCWSAKQSEYAARIMNLESSGQEFVSLRHNLSLEYFRQVHSLRDKVIREISAARLLKKDNEEIA